MVDSQSKPYPQSYPKPYFVGITGGSASGKTYILDHILSAFTPQEITLISQDNYYKDLADQIPDENGKINFDHPDTVRLDLLYEHLKLLAKGSPIQIREYNFNNPHANDKIITYQPAPIIVIEGLFVYLKPEINKILDLKIFLEVDEHIKLSRRIKRDIMERGFELDSILEQYEQDVTPMYRQFIEPCKSQADIVIVNNKKSDTAILVLVNHLKAQLK